MRKWTAAGWMVLLVGMTAQAQGPWMTFDGLPVTAVDAVPGSGGGWIYDATVALDRQGGWRRTEGYAAAPGVYEYFYTYSPPYNSDHMGFESYSYMEIAGPTEALTGNCLRLVVTGGKNELTCPVPSDPAQCLANGLPLYNKDTYLAYLADGQQPVEGGMVVGNHYSYYGNTSPRDNPVPFPAAQGANRFSLYVRVPFELDNDQGDRRRPSETLTVGPYSHIAKSIVYDDPGMEGEVTGHWYNHSYTRGQGWVHILLPGKSEHNNSFSSAAVWPYPQRSMRDLGQDYYNNMYRFYLTSRPYTGLAEPPFEVLIDEIEFRYDPEPCNTETTGTMAVVYNEVQGHFEFSCNDKYLTTTPATYRLRYSFAPITNANWDQATAAVILADASLGVAANTEGLIHKIASGYRGVWAPFELGTAQEMARLTPGTMVYFAVKDESDRPYESQPEEFDVAGDEAVLELIARIDYRMAGWGQGAVVGWY